jgi:hypothetical protein
MYFLYYIRAISESLGFSRRAVRKMFWERVNALDFIVFFILDIHNDDEIYGKGLRKDTGF